STAMVHTRARPVEGAGAPPGLQTQTRARNSASCSVRLRGRPPPQEMGNRRARSPLAAPQSLASVFIFPCPTLENDPMKKIALILAALGGALSLSFVPQDAQQAAAPTDKKPAAYKLGSVVDEGITLTDLDGKTLTFKELRNKVVFIHFWSTQCPFEEVADPKVAELEKHWKDNKDVVVLAINANS